RAITWIPEYRERTLYAMLAKYALSLRSTHHEEMQPVYFGDYHAQDDMRELLAGRHSTYTAATTLDIRSFTPEKHVLQEALYEDRTL
ncbi:hypothetical protein MTO96_039965, partial [Rhipicephalus appendiculatus]